jgi:hypothetical protein
MAVARMCGGPIYITVDRRWLLLPEMAGRRLAGAGGALQVGAAVV